MTEASAAVVREEVTRTVEWVDTDAAGHHHNSFVLRSVEAAEARLFRRLGVLEEYFGAAPRVRQEVDYRAKLYFGQEATTVLEVESVGRSSMVFRFEVWGEAYDGAPSGAVDRRLAASGRFVSVHVPAGSEASAPWPESIRAAVEGGRGSAGGGPGPAS
ncbi:acyl-CoA thioesterase [Sinomonas halotolerans]|uniref:Thioesterase family protein n=1 Tax=Sinomonas halotolerans TaxID=1644133 RepID=A0ABU9X2B8_9MICC